MAWEAWLTAAVIVMVLVALMRNWAGADVVMMGAVTLLMTAGVWSDRLPGPTDMVSGFGNAGLITVAVLFVVAAGLTRTGAMQMVTRPILGRPKTAVRAQARMMIPVVMLSTFFNNTPIVAMLLPVVSDWARKIGVSPSKLLIPLSYATIFGGTCSLIGTSTNLLVYGLLQEDGLVGGEGPDLLGMFTISWIGVPAAVIAVSYCLLTSRWLLPDRKPAISFNEDPRRYTVEMMVDQVGPVAGQTIEAAGLRQLPGLYLAEIERREQVLPAVSSDMVLEAGDRLVFVGEVDSVVDVRRVRGLSPATDQVFKLDGPSNARKLVEAVVSSSNPHLGRSIRDAKFRGLYNAAVIAVARDGQRLAGKIGDIVLHAGDTLLLETTGRFVEMHRNHRDFYLVSAVQDSAPVEHHKAWIALAILVVFIVSIATGWLSPLHAALLAAALMGITGCLTAGQARQSLDGMVLIVIGASIGLGLAVQSSGLAEKIAHSLLGLAGDSPFPALVCIYVMTNVLTALISNNAAAILVYPIAQSLAASYGVDFTPFVIVIMMAASADFSTPIGYQTNLMVYGPGGYRFSDYVRFGLPLNVIVGVVTLALIPVFFPLIPR